MFQGKYSCAIQGSKLASIRSFVQWSKMKNVFGAPLRQRLNSDNSTVILTVVKHAGSGCVQIHILQWACGSPEPLATCREKEFEPKWLPPGNAGAGYCRYGSIRSFGGNDCILTLGVRDHSLELQKGGGAEANEMHAGIAVDSCIFMRAVLGRDAPYLPEHSRAVKGVI